MSGIYCLDCNMEFPTKRNLSKHIQFSHFGIKDYIDRHHGIGKCEICGKDTRFIGLVGYQKACTGKCTAILRRIKLRNNQEKFDIFRNRVRENMRNIWVSRGESGEKLVIFDKVSRSLCYRNSELTDIERQQKFDWSNGKTEKEKLVIIHRMVKNYGKNFVNYSDPVNDRIQKRVVQNLDHLLDIG